MLSVQEKDGMTKECLGPDCRILALQALLKSISVLLTYQNLSL
jgi:hypothetical protein